MIDPVSSSESPKYASTNYQDRRRAMEQKRRQVPAGLMPPKLELRPLALGGRVAGGSPGPDEFCVDLTNPSAPVVGRVRPAGRKKPALTLASAVPEAGRRASERFEGPTTYRVDIPAARDPAWVEMSLDLCRTGFASEMHVAPTELGTSGSYFISSSQGEKVAILKPLDEELGALRARRKDIMMAKVGIQPGTSGFREVIAGKIFSDLVPPTALVTTSYMYFNYNPDREGLQPVKQCSMQKIIPDVTEVHNLEREEFPLLLPHLSPIVMLDICLLNSDRHTGNLLIRRDEEGISGVFPIDHGCILPDNFGTGGLFFWYRVVDPTARFSPSEQARINSIDLVATKEELRIIPDETGAINTYVTSVLLAKTLCETTPMKEIATYQLDDPDGMKGHKSIAYCMLMISALKQKPENDLNKGPFPEIDPTIIQSVITDITSFIGGKKGEEGDFSVHMRVREVLNRYISSGNVEGLLRGAWKSEI